MRNNRSFVAKGLDYAAICICAYFFSLFLFSWIGLKGEALPWISLVLATLLLMLFRLIKRRTKRYPGKATRVAALQNTWLTYLSLLSPRECLDVISKPLSDKYSLSDIKFNSDSNTLPYLSCDYEKERLVVLCVKAVSVESILELARIAMRESTQNAVLCCLTPMHNEYMPSDLPVRISFFSHDRLKKLMPIDFQCPQMQAPAKNHSRTFTKKLVREIFAKDKTLRYTLYGFGLIMLYLLMGFSYAVLPGAACFILAIVSHQRPNAEEALIQ